MEIYSVSKNCKVQSENLVKLKKGDRSFSLIENKKYYIQVSFASWSFSSGYGNVTMGSLLNILPNSQYIIKVTYIDNMYDLEIHQRDFENTTSKQLYLIPLSSCGQ